MRAGTPGVLGCLGNTRRAFSRVQGGIEYTTVGTNWEGGGVTLSSGTPDSAVDGAERGRGSNRASFA